MDVWSSLQVHMLMLSFYKKKINATQFDILCKDIHAFLSVSEYFGATVA